SSEVSISTSASLSTVARVASEVGLLLQAIIIPGSRTTEGHLIEAVAPAWFEIIRAISADPRVAYEISPRRWEEIVAGAYHNAGFDQVVLTPSSGDLGRDV